MSRGPKGRSIGGCRKALLIGVLTLLATPAAAGAQYVAPPPDRGFNYIFDGTLTGSDASFDKWEFAATNGTGSAWSVDPVEGALDPNTSPFGALWYPVRPLGNVVLRLQFQVENSATATRNGGIMVRAPEVRYTGATTAEVLAQKPTGYNYDVCPGAIPVCGLTQPAPSTTYNWKGAEGPYPPASNESDPPFLYSGAYCARNGTHNVTNLAGTGPLTVNSNADNHRHWTQVYCGHEIQINESLTGGGTSPSTDPIKTGSVYGFRNLNAKQSKTYERQDKGVWHKMEIRLVGQQYTVLVDGELINQFNNSVPKIASRNGDPPTMARQLPAGYMGLQSHGGNDRIWYKEIEVKDLTAGDIPDNTDPPDVDGSGHVGTKLSCSPGAWDDAGNAAYDYTWYRSNPVGPSHVHYRAPSQLDLGNFSTPPETIGGLSTGTDNLTWLDSLIVGHKKTYVPVEADAGKVIHCQVAATRHGATVWATAAAPGIISRAPVNVTPPVLKGTPEPGEELLCTKGKWDRRGAATYQWKRNGTVFTTDHAQPNRYTVKLSDVPTTVFTCAVKLANRWAASPFVGSSNSQTVPVPEPPPAV